MKALFKIQKVAKTAQPTLNYTLTLKGKQRETLDLNARVGEVITSPDLQHLQPALKAGSKDAIKAASERIESHTRLFAKAGKTNKGKEARHRDHFTLSAPSGMSHKEFEKLAKKAMPDLAKQLKLNTWVGVFHLDCEHPHFHITSDAYAPSLGRGQRRHIDKDKLEELDSMSWTKHFDAPTPTLDAKRSKRGEKILNVAFKGTSKEKVDFASNVFEHLGGKIDTVEKMAKKLEKLNLPKDYKLNFYDKAGELKTSASITDGKTTLRLSQLVKQKENYEKTEQFKNVHTKLNPPKPKVKTKAKGYTFKTPKIGKLLNIAKNVKQGAEDMTKIPGMIARAAIAATPLGKAVNAAEIAVDVAKKVIDEPKEPKPEKKDYTKLIEDWVNTPATDEELAAWKAEEAEKAAIAKKDAEREQSLLEKKAERAATRIDKNNEPTI